MLIYTGRALMAAALVGVFALGGCSSNDDDDNASKPTTGSSSSSSSSGSSSGSVIIEDLGNVQVHYPPARSSTSAEQVTVRGITETPAEVTAIYINGTAVMSADGLATWSYVAALADGSNTLLVEAEDATGVRTEVQTLTINKITDVISPRMLVVDPTSSEERLLLLDAGAQGVVAIDTASGATTRFSPASASAASLLTEPRGMAVDTARNRLLVFQAQVDALIDESEEEAEESETEQQEETEDEATPPVPTASVNPFIAIDLTTGEQSVLPVAAPADVYLANSPGALTIADERAYITDLELVYFDEQLKRVAKETDGARVGAVVPIVYSLDLSTGATTILSRYEATKPDITGRILGSITTTTDADHLYALEYTTVYGASQTLRLVKIAKADGSRTYMSLDNTTADENVTVSLLGLANVRLDYPNNRLIIGTATRVLAADLATNKVTVLSANTVPANSTPLLRKVESLALDPTDGTIYLADDATDSFIAVDGTTGARRLVSGAGGDSANAAKAFYDPACVALSLRPQSALVCDSHAGTAYSVNLITGSKSTLADRTDLDAQGGPLMRHPVAATSYGTDGGFLILDQPSPLLARDEQSVYPRLLSLDGTLSLTSTFPAGFTLQDVAYDPASDTAYVAALGTLIYAVELDVDPPQARQFSGYGIPDRSYSFGRIKSIALDSEHNRLLVLDASNRAVTAVDRDTGARSPLSSLSVPTEGGPAFKLPQAIVVDAEHNRALVLDSVLDAIIAVDLESGQREIVYQSVATDAVRLINGKDLALHPLGYVLVVDDVKDTLMAVDLTTREAVTLAR